MYFLYPSCWLHNAAPAVPPASSSTLRSGHSSAPRCCTRLAPPTSATLPDSRECRQAAVSYSPFRVADRRPEGGPLFTTLLPKVTQSLPQLRAPPPGCPLNNNKNKVPLCQRGQMTPIASLRRGRPRSIAVRSQAFRTTGCRSCSAPKGSSSSAPSSNSSSRPRRPSRPDRGLRSRSGLRLSRPVSWCGRPRRPQRAAPFLGPSSTTTCGGPASTERSRTPLRCPSSIALGQYPTEHLVVRACAPRGVRPPAPPLLRFLSTYHSEISPFFFPLLFPFIYFGGRGGVPLPHFRESAFRWAIKLTEWCIAGRRL